MTSSFNEFFRTATGGYDPYPYQKRFAEADSLPHLLRAPTGAGKTATAVLGWLWRWVSRKTDTPRRLIYCLPMRVLVEQSEQEARKWVDALVKERILEKVVRVHVLMGGVEADKWYLYPEEPAILIGTQDMLLSRALNRGYAASRFHWPIDFGLLNNDCLWVFDEPQLMGSGVSTSAQLAGLRKALGMFGPSQSVWMSATLEPNWLETIDYRGKFLTDPLELSEADYSPELPLHRRMHAEKILAMLCASVTKDGKEVAAAVAKVHEKGTQTLVVLNTVERAKAVYSAIKKHRHAPQDMLIHSRFRPKERKMLNDRLKEASSDRIIISTQVIEAGVDISARTLVTELAPWASVVQRIGRCNRTGADSPGRVYWIDFDEQKLASPYDAKALTLAREQLTKLEGKDVSPKALDDFKQEQKIFLPFEHKHVIRRRDILDLFDTSPDLSGNDIDISRFVRGDEPETDVQVFWRPDSPDNEWDADERRRQANRRVELCNVPIGSFKTDFLGGDKTAYRFDYLDGEWRKLGKKDANAVVPGQVFWIVADQGGYDPELGWSPSADRLSDELLIPLPETVPPRRRQRPEGFYDSDEWSQAEWKTIAEHTDEVVRELAAILDPSRRLPLSDRMRGVLEMAARWHDWGKAHAVFQSGIADVINDPRDRSLPADQRRQRQRDEKWRGCSLVAKAPDEFWQRYRRLIRPADPNANLPEKRALVKRFRHELASALGVLALDCAGLLPANWQSLNEIERHLALYLIASHHGKVRLSIRTMPDESPLPPDLERRRCAAGVWDGDKLPVVDLGGRISPPESVLSLDPMQLGGTASWSAWMLRMRDDNEFGPFRLTYLEALLRAADCRASDEWEGDANG